MLSRIKSIFPAISAFGRQTERRPSDPVTFGAKLIVGSVSAAAARLVQGKPALLQLIAGALADF